MKASESLCHRRYIRQARFEMEIVFLGIKEIQILGVVEKNVGVVAFAMFNLEHHRRAASERPSLDSRPCSIYLIDQGEGQQDRALRVQLAEMRHFRDQLADKHRQQGDQREYQPDIERRHQPARAEQGGADPQHARWTAR